MGSSNARSCEQMGRQSGELLGLVAQSCALSQKELPKWQVEVAVLSNGRVEQRFRLSASYNRTALEATMEVRELDRNRRFSAEKMTKINLFETPRFFLDQYCLEPGQAQKLHRHAENDKVYIVLEGQGRFQVGDEERVLGPHQAVLAPAGVEHGVVNPTPERLVLLTFMAPHPGWVEGKGSGGDQPVSEGKRAAS